ncbi:MAG: type II toxin-antitoxin system Phd/YefM family antitoxin [Acidimicrobiales bacterium]
MTRIGVRELRQHASRYLGLVKTGVTVEVTERGALVALLVPPSPATSVRDHLISEGRLSPAKVPFRPPTARFLTGTGRTASDTLAELRAEPAWPA